jgi:hypothetical protein
MSGNYIGQFYEAMLKDLREWIWNNDKLRHKITRHNLQYLFEMDKQRGLSIDLRRFEPEYYRQVFYPPEEKKPFIDEFVRKICEVIRKSLNNSGKEDLTITITYAIWFQRLVIGRLFIWIKNTPPHKLPHCLKKKKTGFTA